eukprot:SAG31_NODE_1510_length_8062_cov_4.204194_3_plen_153_part_00
MIGCVRTRTRESGPQRPPPPPRSSASASSWLRPMRCRHSARARGTAARSTKSCAASACSVQCWQPTPAAVRTTRQVPTALGQAHRAALSYRRSSFRAPATTLQGTLPAVSAGRDTNCRWGANRAGQTGGPAVPFTGLAARCSSGQCRPPRWP